MQQIQWQDRFNIGVEIVDRAHQRLFSIVQKILELYVERHEDQFACVEGIKYFKAYAIKHFAEEEAYMQSIGYPGYLAHKRIHDRMKRQTLPALERELYATHFSTESVHRFIGVCTGWLTGHIVIEDRAITGRTAGDFGSIQPDDERSVIHAVLLSPMQEMFGRDIQFAGSFSPEDKIADARHYALTYLGPEGQRLRFVLIIGEPLMLRAAGAIFEMEFHTMNEIVRFAIQEVAQHLIQRAAACFGAESDAYQLEEDRFLTSEEYKQSCTEHSPQYSLLFRVRHDCFALCIDQSPAHT